MTILRLLFRDDSSIFYYILFILALGSLFVT